MTFPAFQGHTRYPRWEAVPYAFFPKSPYHRQAPQILHILQSWKLCRPGETCSLHPVLEEEGKTKELKKCGRHHLSSKTCSPFSIVTFKQTWSIISKLNFLGRERYIFFFRLIMFADFSINCSARFQCIWNCAFFCHCCTKYSLEKCHPTLIEIITHRRDLYSNFHWD